MSVLMGREDTPPPATCQRPRSDTLGRWHLRFAFRALCLRLCLSAPYFVPNQAYSSQLGTGNYLRKSAIYRGGFVRKRSCKGRALPAELSGSRPSNDGAQKGRRCRPPEASAAGPGRTLSGCCTDGKEPAGPRATGGVGSYGEVKVPPCLD